MSYKYASSYNKKIKQAHINIHGFIIGSTLNGVCSTTLPVPLIIILSSLALYNKKKI